MKLPYPYQQQVIDVAAYRNVFVGDECGLGKTLVAIESIKCVLQKATIKHPVLIIAPKRVLDQWSEAFIEKA